VRRIAIIGMNNPYSQRPEYALHPDPPGCTGWRLWKMTEARTGATQTDYRRAFHRYNLTVGKFDPHTARERWREMEPDLLREFDTVVLLGSAVRRATGILLPDVHISHPLIAIPHPSGLNRWYNSETNRKVIEVLMEELYTDAITP
jgi:hypothetical protein